MQDRLAGDGFIVVSFDGPQSRKGTLSLWATAPDVERHINSLLEGGVPSSSIRVFRGRPAAISARVPVTV